MPRPSNAYRDVAVDLEQFCGVLSGLVPHLLVAESVGVAASVRTAAVATVYTVVRLHGISVPRRKHMWKCHEVGPCTWEKALEIRAS
jgi:hypothetical protein